MEIIYGSVVRRCIRTILRPDPACCSEGVATARRSGTENPWIMMMVNVVMLVVRKGILRCEFWAVHVSWMLDGPNIPPLRSTLNV